MDTRFKKGQHASPKTEFKKGQRVSPETEFKKGQRVSPETEFKKGNKAHWKEGKPLCLVCGKELTTYHTKRCMLCSIIFRRGYNSSNWRGGLNKNKSHVLNRKKAWRQNNREKIYKSNNEYQRRKNKTKLTIKTIQLIYEDNIKKYGTLTCYLCMKSIPFGKDQLEHKTPLSRGGTNEYSNLAISCQHCNCRKHDKTVEEYTQKREE